LTVFIPGETIAHEFYLPFKKGDIAKVIATYRQDGHVVLARTIYPREIENGERDSHFVIALSQEESLLFEDNKYFYVQLNIHFVSRTNETRAASIELRGENLLQHLREVVT